MFFEVLFYIWVNNPARELNSKYSSKAQLRNAFPSYMLREGADYQ